MSPHLKPSLFGPFFPACARLVRLAALGLLLSATLAPARPPRPNR
jgi:hypothetical protein